MIPMPEAESAQDWLHLRRLVNITMEDLLDPAVTREELQAVWDNQLDEHSKENILLLYTMNRLER